MSKKKKTNYYLGFIVYYKTYKCDDIIPIMDTLIQVKKHVGIVKVDNILT